MGRPRDPNKDHGLSGYVNRGCRCDVCRAANAQRTRDITARRKLIPTDSPEFLWHGTLNGYNYGCRCEKCRAYEKQYRTSGKQAERRSAYAKSLVGTHGLTGAEADAFKEGKVCAICGTADNLRVDHCHITGAIRGVLCNRHNLALGKFDDDILYLKKAIEYLEASREEEVQEQEI